MDTNTNIKASDFKIYLLLTLSVVFLYYFLEWLFFITKPSPLNINSWLINVQILLIAPAPLILCSVLLLWLIKIIRSFSDKADIIYPLLPGLIISCGVLLLIENFTTSVFKFNLSYYDDFRRLMYALLFCFIYYKSFKNISSIQKQIRQSGNYKILLIALITLTSFSSILLSLNFYFSSDYSISTDKNKGEHIKKPNIIILSSDGLSAANLSAYGYAQQNTPFLNEFSKEALLFRNHYTNNAKTTGSVISLLTGKHPLTTKVIFPPDLLRGQDSYQHLPGVLKSLGYYSADITTRHYIDAVDLNMKNSFDFANGRNLNNASANPWFESLFGEASIFLNLTWQRISERLLHIFYLEKMPNPFLDVTSVEKKTVTDEDRINQLNEIIDNAPQPFFISTHLLNTHGPRFDFREKHFSVNHPKQKRWQKEFYNDAIFTFDQYLQELVRKLKEKGLYDNTILIITSDHGLRWSQKNSIPLIIKFPGLDIKGESANVSQRIDIAPTILDYMNVPLPDWLDGESLLSKNLPADRIIFSSNRTKSKGQSGQRTAISEPPFYTLGSLLFIKCGYWYELKFKDNKFHSGKLPDWSKSCEQESKVTEKEARKIIFDKLISSDYKVSEVQN
jgi:arylsulfatase A-like enzyme